MSSNEKKFLNELIKLLDSYAIDEVICEERDGKKFIVFYSTERYLAFRLFKYGWYYDILSHISGYAAEKEV